MSHQRPGRLLQEKTSSHLMAEGTKALQEQATKGKCLDSEQLQAYNNGTMPLDERKLAIAHFMKCSDCAIKADK